MRVDSGLFYLTCAIVSIGVVFSLSLTSYTILMNHVAPLHFFYRQAIFAIFSIFIMWGISNFQADKFLHKFCFTAFIVCFLLLFFMNFFPSSLVTEVNGAARWIKFPGFAIAPVEFFKFGFIYFLAWSFNRKINNTKKDFLQEFKILVPYLVVFIFIFIAVGIFQNDLGQIVVLAGTMLVVALFAGTSYRFMSLCALILSICGYLFIILSDHRIARVKSWWGGIQDFALSMPFVSQNLATKLRIEDAQAPYQVGHSLNAINNGGIFGQGLGIGNFKLGFLSEVHTDFVLAGIAEEVGFVGILVICTIFFMILYKIIKIAVNLENNVYKLFCIGIAFMFLFSFVINSYGITSISPVKGIAVPFLSYGGSHLVAACMCVGLVLMISKKAKF